VPAITRVIIYGELAQLEGFVDEYYQAMGMDVRCKTWLREKILEQSDDNWRTHADTRERLELQAQDWVTRYVLGGNPELFTDKKRYSIDYIVDSLASNTLSTELRKK
jgi:cobalamin biosynthesis Mg chelatase CobN